MSSVQRLISFPSDELIRSMQQVKRILQVGNPPAFQLTSKIPSEHQKMQPGQNISPSEHQKKWPGQNVENVASGKMEWRRVWAAGAADWGGREDSETIPK